MWIVFAITAALGLLYTFLRGFNYWKERGVPQKSALEIFKNYFELFVLRKYNLAEVGLMSYADFSDQPFYGGYSFGTPMIVIRDPQLIRQVTVKDFNHFTDHANTISNESETLWSRNLFSLKGDRWRYMRATLSPSFTSSKMKAMFRLMSDCAEQAARFFEEQGKPVIEVELKDVFTRYTTDVIATCSFGVTCDSLRDRDNEFYTMGLKLTDFTSAKKALQMLLYFACPKLAKLLGISFLDVRVSKFFQNIVEETVRMREQTGTYRPDMIQLLMEARKGNLKYEETQDTVKDTGFATIEESEVGKAYHADKEITMLDMTAQALVFFFAGFETASTLMSFMGYELTVNPDIQKRLIDEVDATARTCQGQITYDQLNKMTYLDTVISETLRKWPPLVMLDRTCTTPYKLSSPNGSCKVKIEKGTIILAPIYGVHMDSDFYPDPQRFNPDRFSNDSEKPVDPATFFTFGSGPRSCIGSRFALLETKVVFYHLLRKFEFVLVDKTPVPLEIERKTFKMQAEGGFWLGLRRRKT